MGEGLPVSFDVGIHHLLMTEKDIGFFDAHARFAPPLRTEDDRIALSRAAAAGLAAICSTVFRKVASPKAISFSPGKGLT